MSFSKNDLDKIKSKISIKDELEKKTKLIQKGKDYWCCCPFHDEKTPSCKINEQPGSFYCFGCGAKGDIFTIYTDLYNYNFIDAVKELSEKAGVQIDFQNRLNSKREDKIEEILELTCLWFHNNLKDPAAKQCNEYLKERKLTKNTIEKFKLGFSSNSNLTLYKFLNQKGYSDSDLIESNVVKFDKNNKIRDYFFKRLVFPIMNIYGKVVGFGARALDNSNPKYINSPESNLFQKRHLLYNLNNAKHTARKKNNLLICEGYMDVISLYQNGLMSVVAPLGTALTEDQIKLSWNFCSTPTIMFDGDSAGTRASYKTAIMALKLIEPKKFIQFITLPKESDPDSYINKVSMKKFIEKIKSPESLSNFIINKSASLISLKKVDEKISYNKYLDELVMTINDKTIQYFYKNEFKNLFFNKIREVNSFQSSEKIVPKKINTNLHKKQILSFFGSLINHIHLRAQIINELINSELLDDNELLFLKEMQKINIINLKTNEIVEYFKNTVFINTIKDSLTLEIYKLFPYSSPIFDQQEAIEEITKSLNNLNTRLLNLKKINKSLDNFANDANQLNWNDLLSINTEILNEN